MLSKAKRTPIKHSVALRAVCAQHNVTVEGSNLMVCQGRKVVYVLRVGILHSKNCIAKESPTPSFRRDSGVPESGWKTVAVPNGWKVAVIVDNDVWTAEVGYSRERDLPQYQFTRMDEEGKVMVQSEWCFTPSGAFKSASAEFIGDENAWGRHNGKLYLGCTYDYPQVFLRQYFRKKLESGDQIWDEEIKSLVKDWLNPAKQSPKAAFNAENGVGPDSYAAKESASDHNTDSTTAGNVIASETAQKPGKSGGVDATDVESERSEVDRKKQHPAAEGVPRKRVKRSPPVVSPGGNSGASPGEDLLQKRIESVTSMWIGRVWMDIPADAFSTEAKLRRFIPGVPAYPTAVAQSRAFTSVPGQWLSEEEILAILFHVDGQVQRVSMDKQVRFSMGAQSGQGGPAPSFSPAIGFVPQDAVKNIINLVSNKRSLNDVIQVKMEDFLQRLENLESTAEYLFPVLTQTLFLFPIEDVFKRVEEGKFQVSKENLNFIQSRMRVLDVDQKDKFRVFANAAEFVRALTFLPRSSFVTKFMSALHFIAPTLALSSPSSVIPIGPGNGSAFASFPTMVNSQWIANRQPPTGPPRSFVGMPVLVNSDPLSGLRNSMHAWMAPPPEFNPQLNSSSMGWFRPPTAATTQPMPSKPSSS